MEGEQRVYGFLPLMADSHRYQVGKVRFHVISVFNGRAPIEERLADLMVEDLYEESSKQNEENEN
jgi:hypothetical protein